MNIYNLHTGRVAIIGPGRLGTALAYKFGRDHRRVDLYYHDGAICQEINKTRYNPIHLTHDLAKKLGGIDSVPQLPEKVGATNDLEYVIKNNDFIILALTVGRLSEFLTFCREIIREREGGICLISPLKGMIASSDGKRLLTPSMIVRETLKGLEDKYRLLCVGGPFFDTDIALGNPVCITVAGEKKLAFFVKENLINFNRREFSTYYNYDVMGVEICGALKNTVANLKGVSDSLNLGNSLPGTLFTRAGVEMRSISKLMGGGFQAFLSQSGVGDMFVTVSSEASKNYRYGKHFFELFDGDHQNTHQRVTKMIDGTPEGPSTIRNIRSFLREHNIYSPLFNCAYDVFNTSASKEETRELIVQACQLDRRNREYVGPVSRALYAIAPRHWYRRDRGWLSSWGTI
ncbi:MAG: hypothetical protein K9K75_01140 [Deltaproteobacteria bacterium]|nr:hypothetical protein [Deltaproteobacteria bacterium]